MYTTNNNTIAGDFLPAIFVRPGEKPRRLDGIHHPGAHDFLEEQCYGGCNERCFRT